MNPCLPALGILIWAASAAFPAAPSDTLSALSPSGRITVRFLPGPKTAYGDSGNPGAPTSLAYTLVFQTRQGKVLNRAAFTDVYGFSPEAQPRPCSLFAARISWSPKEDYAVLPEEDWERPPGQAVRKIVNLNPRGRWKEAVLSFDLQHFVDRYHMVGEAAGDCRHSVMAFDGRSGKTKPIQEGGKGVSYGITEFRAPYLWLENRVGDCPGEGEEAKFAPRCYRVDVRNWKSVVAKCR
jgi:hypothetical protein